MKFTFKIPYHPYLFINKNLQYTLNTHSFSEEYLGNDAVIHSSDSLIFSYCILLLILLSSSSIFSNNGWCNVSLNGNNKNALIKPTAPNATIGWIPSEVHKLFKNAYAILPIDPPADIKQSAKDLTTAGNSSET